MRCALVTGVQTCALPIYLLRAPFLGEPPSSTCHFAFLDAKSLQSQRRVHDIKLRQHSDTMWIGKMGVWNLIVLRSNHKSPFPFANLRRTSRIPKLLPQRMFPNAKHVVWIDANKYIEQTVAKYLKLTLQHGQYPLAFPLHVIANRSSVGESVVPISEEHTSELQSF